MSDVSKLRGKFLPLPNIAFEHGKKYVVRDMSRPSMPQLYIMQYDAAIRHLTFEFGRVLYPYTLSSGYTAIPFDEFNAILDST